MIGGRGLVVLVVLTLLAAVGAWFVTEGDARRPDADAGDLLLPGLDEGINDVETVTIAGPEERFTVRRTEAGWVMEDKDGHPVRFETVKSTLMALADLRRMEPKTDNPELYSRLGVEDPGQPDAVSTRVTAVGGEGGTLCDVVIGNAGTPRGTRYVREAGQGRAWQVRGDVSVDPRAVGWLESTVVELPAARVRSVSVRHGDGELVRVAKASADDVSWELEDVPEGREPMSSTIGRTLAGALERLDFDDVAASATRPLPPADPVETLIETFDGLSITVLSAKEPAGDEEGDEERTWATLAVEILPEAEEDVRAEGEALASRVETWTYSLSPYRAANLRKRMQELTREIPEPEPEPDPESGAEAAGGEAADAPGGGALPEDPPSAPADAAGEPGTAGPDEPTGEAEDADGPRS